jgi:prephenate dehydrogenase
VAGSDAVVLAVPVDEVVPVGRRVRPFLKAGAFVTDVGSVKGPIARAFAGWPVFVGAHPMCGSEKTGIAYARRDLYRGATCVLTPVRGTSRAALAAANRLWTTAGARTLILPPEEHDRRVALVSHLPHLVAEALVMALPSRAKWASRLAAGSFRDATRVAAANPALWASIFAMNRPALRRAAAGFRRALAALLKAGPDEKRLREVVRCHASFSGSLP